MIKVVLADDCELFQDGFKLLLEKENTKEIELATFAKNGKELLEKVKLHKPKVVITSNKLRDIDTYSVCRNIKEKNSRIAILTINQEDEEDIAYYLLEAGADGFIARNLCKQDIIKAIKNLANGKPYYCPAISSKIFNLITKNAINQSHKKVIHFSKQELLVIQFICKQLTTREIAIEMNLCSRTIEEYRNRIQEKIGAKNVAGMVVYALNNNIIKKNQL